MLAKMSRKNQVTVPKKVVERLGFAPNEDKYIDFEIQGNTVLMKPVTVTIEEKISDDQADRFRSWALDHKKDLSFDSPEKATTFLKRRMKKK